jgi:hypothetical protein
LPIAANAAATWFAAVISEEMAPLDFWVNPDRAAFFLESYVRDRSRPAKSGFGVRGAVPVKGLQ